jgi:Uma2 family endonuclease
MAGRSAALKISVAEYFRLPESMRPMELVYGVVREPPAPRYGHQSVVTTLTALLHEHVRTRGLGQICVSPVDVVLDKEAALVVQPDIVFVAAPHLDRVKDRIWGPPDLVVEVLSRRTALRDSTTKLAWYVRYGVRECWLVDLQHRSIEIVELQQELLRRTRCVGDVPMRSGILPDWDASPTRVFS